MKVYDDFLNMVIEQNSDEYEGPENVVFRYKTLKDSNKRLKHSQKISEQQIEQLAEEITKYREDQVTKMVTKGGSITSTQKDLEMLEAQKEQIMAMNEESAMQRQSEICEHGQILMAINNLYLKVSKNTNY